MELDEHRNGENENNDIEDCIADWAGDKNSCGAYAASGSSGLPKLSDWLARKEEKTDEDHNIDSVQKNGCVSAVAEISRRADTQVKGQNCNLWEPVRKYRED